MAKPTYTNTSGEARPFESKVIAAGGTVSTNDGKYRWPIPTGFELTTQGDAPIVTLHKAVIGGSIVLPNLAKYLFIRIQNQSGAGIDIQYGDDTTNTAFIASGGDETWGQDDNGDGRRNFDKLTITGAGAEKVYVTAWKVG